MRTNYSFFYPLLEKKHAWSAINWRCSAPEQFDLADFSASLAFPEMADLSRLLPLVLSIKPEWLCEDAFLATLDAPQGIFILPEEILGEDALLEQCKTLRSQGRHLGIQLRQPGSWKTVSPAMFDYLSVNASFSRNELDQALFADQRANTFHKIAHHINTYEMFHWVTQKGFELYDSNFLTSRNPGISQKPDLARMKLLKLLGIVDRDGDTREIEAIFREEPKLSYNLLRLVNSVSVGARTKINNFAQAITILGRRQLQRWLQLLIYANNLSDSNAPNPLMQLAAYRGHLLELLSKSMNSTSQTNSDNAFMTGLFSLLDVLLNMSMGDILKELPLDDPVSRALNAPLQDGKLGLLLSSVIAAGAGEVTEAAKILAELGITPEAHAAAQITALHWAARINLE